MNQWQIADGSDSRDYAHDFLRYRLAFVGGGKNVARLQRVCKGDRLTSSEASGRSSRPGWPSSGTESSAWPASRVGDR
jgi:hypothetical protein